MVAAGGQAHSRQTIRHLKPPGTPRGIPWERGARARHHESVSERHRAGKSLRHVPPPPFLSIIIRDMQQNSRNSRGARRKIESPRASLENCRRTDNFVTRIYSEKYGDALAFRVSRFLRALSPSSKTLSSCAKIIHGRFEFRSARASNK